VKSLGGLLVFALALGGCSIDRGSGCEDARTEMVKQIKSVCQETIAYADSPFCQTCVNNEYYSTTGPADCECAPLTLDAEFCSYSKDGEAKPAIRSAIDDANQTCAAFVLPRAASRPDPSGGAGASDGSDGGTGGS